MRQYRIGFSVHQTISFGLCYLLILCGCSQKSGTELAEATGILTVDGRPVSSVMIEFAPVTGEAAASHGITDAQGKFQMKLNRKTPGARVGANTVRFVEMDAKESFNLLPELYQSTNTGLIAEVTSKGPNVFRFELQSNADKK